MKKKTTKLRLNKNVISQLNEVKGGVEAGQVDYTFLGLCEKWSIHACQPRTRITDCGWLCQDASLWWC